MADERQLTGQKIDHYLIGKELGRGTYGVVYLARHDVMDREVAFKLLLPEWVNTPGYIKNFFQEAKLAAQLDHPNVIQALEARQSESGLCYFVMEYVKGRSIEEIRIHNPELLSLPFLLRISRQLADAMNYAWTTRRMTHGDIKPGNLLIREQDQTLKLADLGLARIESMLNQEEIMATPLYAAPELISGQFDKVGPASDVYSFGIMFYELAAGKAPFQGEVEELLQLHLTQAPLPLIEANPDIDRDLSDFVGRMIAKDPADRPDWAEVKETLARWDSDPVPAAPAPAKKRTLPPAPQGSAISIQNDLQSNEARAKAWRARLNNVQSKNMQWINWVIIVIALIALAAAIFIAYWGSLPQPTVLQYDDEELGVTQKVPSQKRPAAKSVPKK